MKSNKIFLRGLSLVFAGVLLLGGVFLAGGQGSDRSLYLPAIVRNARQPNANTQVRPYNEPFQYGLNPGYYGNGWDDKGVYGLCYDAGCRSARNTLPDSFLAQWGDTIRVNTFAYIVDSLDFAEITTFLGSPRTEWRDATVYDGQQSKLWQGMYEPIWDNGENGTPVNDANRFAAYVWKVVYNYGPFIRFYEIVNEPDYTYSSYGWVEPGTAGSWWDSPPQPKDLPNLNAPIYPYIRLLRIAYEVVHRYDPDAYVTPGGIGYDSFLDALLRYSDNPAGGAVTNDYPFTGGAYFDALSFHIYPQYGTRHWDGSQWVPDRHSDKAVEVVLDSYQRKLATLAARGYDGVTYPEKVLLITEVNVARKQIGETLGGEELQRNFTIKTLVKAQQAGIVQIYWYMTGEVKNDDDAGAESYDLMGFYENLKRDTPGSQKMTPQGIANRTTYQQLYGWTYDPTATQALGLPAGADGVAFRQGDALRYVLWAKTTQDRSEAAAVTIDLPGSYDAVAWNGTTSVVNGMGLQLYGAPVFLTPR
ncbi:MAG: hypothetical protein ACOYYS_05990 [Chloroflexota bacterium]